MVIETARVSRSRFYELFSGSDSCISALLEELVGFVEHHLRERRIDELPWDERVRQALWVILSCLDQEPLLARACVLHSVGASGPAAERREQVIASLVDQVDAGREISGSDNTTPMTAEGVVGAATRLVYSRLANREPSPVTDLFAELTGLILLPYLGADEVRSIQSRPSPAPVAVDGSNPLGGALDTSAEATDPLKGIAIRVTQRTALALQAVSQHPGASNRAVASRAGISDPGQASKLLARLERLGLITNQAVTGTKWELNSWALTPAGNRVVQLLGGRPSVRSPEVPPMASLVGAEGA
jgi:AcrR family transcriptional regulator